MAQRNMYNKKEQINIRLEYSWQRQIQRFKNKSKEQRNRWLAEIRQQESERFKN